MTSEQLDQLNRRAHQAGHPDIPSHYSECLLALVAIADANSGPWGRVAYEALHGRGDYAPKENHDARLAEHAPERDTVTLAAVRDWLAQNATVDTAHLLSDFEARFGAENPDRPAGTTSSTPPTEET